MNGESSYNLFRKPRNLWCFIVILTIDRVWTQCREDTQCPGDQVCLVEPQSSNFKFEVIILSIVILKRVMQVVLECKKNKQKRFSLITNFLTHMKFKVQTSTEEGQGSFFYWKFISLKLHYLFLIIYLLFVSYLKYFFETPSDNVPITKYECIDAKSSMVQLCKLEKCHTNKCIEVSSICHFDILSSHVLEQWWNGYLPLNYAHIL